MKVDKRKAIQLLEKAVKAKGDDHSLGTVLCRYLNGNDGTPSCIVGHVLYDLIEPTDFVYFFSNERNTVRIDDLWSALDWKLDIEFTSGAKKVLLIAQDCQDGRSLPSQRAWGEAVKAAKNA